MPKRSCLRTTLLSLLLISGACALYADDGLAAAVKAGNAAAVRSLLKSGADPDQPDADGTTPLAWAANKENLEITEALLAGGAKPDATSRYRVTPLNVAAETGNATILERLLAAGADVNGVSEEGQTALMTAARNGTHGRRPRADQTRREGKCGGIVPWTDTADVRRRRGQYRGRRDAD